MNTSSKLNKYYAFVLIAILAVAALVIPYPAEEVPEWKVLYIDEHYLPGGGKKLAQSTDNAFFGHKSEVEAVTDKNGFVTFGPVFVWAGVLERMLAWPAGWLGWDTKTHVSVFVSDTCSARVTWTVGEGAKPDKLVCPQ